MDFDAIVDEMWFKFANRHARHAKYRTKYEKIHQYLPRSRKEIGMNLQRSLQKLNANER